MGEVNPHLVRDLVQFLGDKDTDPAELAPMIWEAMSPSEHMLLQQVLFGGPLAADYVFSPEARDELIEVGLIARCSFLGTQGYIVATELAGLLFEHAGAFPYMREPLLG